MLDYIIVGQGIAGTVLSWVLRQKGCQVLVIDESIDFSSSVVAAGLTKPITGKRFAKTWMADELIPTAHNAYKQLEIELNGKFFETLKLVNLFSSVKQQNDWSVRVGTTEYTDYLRNDKIIYLDATKIDNPFGGFEIFGGSRVDGGSLLRLYRQYLQKNNAILESRFNFEVLKVENDKVVYDTLEAGKIIFCDGWSCASNPYFKHLPFRVAKGECLLIEVKDLNQDSCITKDVMVVPWYEKNIYYVGATHEWYPKDANPSDSGEKFLEDGLRSFLKLPYKIVDRKAAIRPTVRDRRPFLGFRGDHKSVGIFNGMGTKGFSLVPFFANHFADYLLLGKPLMPEVDINRF